MTEYSDDAIGGERPAAAARSEDDGPAASAARIAAAMAAMADGVEPSGGSWNRITERLDHPTLDDRVRGLGPVAPRVVAAAVLVLVVILGLVVLRGGRDAANVVTQPAKAPAAILATTDTGRLVELDGDGHEVRTIWDGGHDGFPDTGDLAVSADGSTAYVTWDPQPPGSGEPGAACAGGYLSSQILAVPLSSGGTPTIAVPVGGALDLSADGRWMAYVGPADDERCTGDPSRASNVSILDLRTGVRTQLADRATPLVGPARRLRWAAEGRLLLGVPDWPLVDLSDPAPGSAAPTAPAEPPGAHGVPGSIGVDLTGTVPRSTARTQEVTLIARGGPNPAPVGPDGSPVSALGAVMEPANTTEVVVPDAASSNPTLVAVEHVGGVGVGATGSLLVTRHLAMPIPDQAHPAGLAVASGDTVAGIVPPDGEDVRSTSLATDPTGTHLLLAVRRFEPHEVPCCSGRGLDRTLYRLDGGGPRAIATGVVGAKWLPAPGPAGTGSSKSPTPNATERSGSLPVGSTGVPGSVPGTTPVGSSDCPTDLGPRGEDIIDRNAPGVPDPVRRTYERIVRSAAVCGADGGPVSGPVDAVANLSPPFASGRLPMDAYVNTVNALDSAPVRREMGGVVSYAWVGVPGPWDCVMTFAIALDGSIIGGSFDWGGCAGSGLDPPPLRGTVPAPG